MIGTGTTVVRLILKIAEEVGHLSVFQCSPNYWCPLRNTAIDPDAHEEIKASYDSVLAKCHDTFASFMYDFHPRKTFNLPKEERLAFDKGKWV